MVSSNFRRQIEGYGLTTANILYRLPDYRGVLQQYIWQEYDLAPRFPELNKFLDFWGRESGWSTLPRDGRPQDSDWASRSQSCRR